MAQKIEKAIIEFIEGILFSYGQVFFSKQKAFSIILLLISFFDWIAGISGLVAVIIANLAALLIGFKKQYVAQGFYGFNVLMVGLSMGILFQPGIAFFFVLFFAALFTFFLTIWLEGFFGKYNLPYLGWPFLIGIWMVSLATRQFSALDISERGVFLLNEIYQHGGMPMLKFYYWANDLPIHESIGIYLKSLAAIFFQYNMLAGILIALGLLIYSRIAFLLSLLGFFSAYLYYLLIGVNITELSYTNIGFNYILSAIALGGFFIVPSRSSFLWVILLTPIIAFVISATSTFFNMLNLPIYSLAFNIIAIMFLYILKFRERNFYNPELVAIQQFSPERNLYAQHNYKSRFDINVWTLITLPVHGEWVVSQGHDGEHTHRQEWRHAWDFEIMDEEGKNFESQGFSTKDYYCYGKPVLAPGDGVVQEIQDGIPDNLVGEMNLGNNWGNTIVIKHTEYLYSKLSHLKTGSIKTYKGAFVKKGEPIALCGNSGRSVVPHLHFQVQSTPFIGSKTIDYPFASYLVKVGSQYELKTYERPQKGEIVSNIIKNDSLFRAFNFTPGQTISFKAMRNGGAEENVDWEVKSDMYNYTFLECKATGSKAYYRNDGNLFYFTHFDGNKNSLLYYFYLAAYKVVLGYYDKLSVEDIYPLNAFKNGLMLFLHDFIAPFAMFMKGVYNLKYVRLEDNLMNSSIELESSTRLSAAGKIITQYQFELSTGNGRIEKFTVKSKNIEITAKEIAS